MAARQRREGGPSCRAPPGEPAISLHLMMFLPGALRSPGLVEPFNFGCHGKGRSSLGQFAEPFYLYEISLWLPEGKEISIPNGSAKAPGGRWGELCRDQPDVQSNTQVCGICSQTLRDLGGILA